MTIDEINKYILHYLKADKTHSAIMLTGAWGSGKSYYIQNNLCPFLAQKENGEIQSIIVSLYGMTRLSDISKSLIYGDPLYMLKCQYRKRGIS